MLYTKSFECKRGALVMVVVAPLKTTISKSIYKKNRECIFYCVRSITVSHGNIDNFIVNVNISTSCFVYFTFVPTTFAVSIRNFDYFIRCTFALLVYHVYDRVVLHFLVPNGSFVLKNTSVRAMSRKAAGSLDTILPSFVLTLANESVGSPKIRILVLTRTST